MIKEAYMAGVASALEKIANEQPGAISSPPSMGSGIESNLAAQTQVKPTRSTSGLNRMRFKHELRKTNLETSMKPLSRPFGKLR